MSFRRWFLPLGRYSPLAHLPAPDWRSLCGRWDLSRPGVIEAEAAAAQCVVCAEILAGRLDRSAWLSPLALGPDVEAGASHAGGGKESGVAIPRSSLSPLATPAVGEGKSQAERLAYVRRTCGAP